MRILHTSDWHLGKLLFGRLMLDDQKYFIDNCFFPAIEKHEPDCVAISGDIFDRAIAPVAALALFDDTLNRVAEMGVPVVAITGNHDGAQRLALGTRLMRSSGIHIFTSLADCLETVRITGRDGVTAAIHPLPFFDSVQARALTGMEDCSDYAALYSAVLERVPMDVDCPNILLSHCTVLGSERSESESGVMVGGSSELNGSIFSGFDGVLLGHLHSPQKPAHNVAYSGAMLKYSFDKNERDKSMGLINVGADSISFETIPIKPLRDMRVISGSFDELLDGSSPPSEDYVYAELTDRALVYEPMARLRERYPNILGMRYAERTALSGEQSDRAVLRRGLHDNSLSDESVFRAFLHGMCGVEADDGALAVFERLRSKVSGEEGENET